MAILCFDILAPVLAFLIIGSIMVFAESDLADRILTISKRK